MIASHLAFQTGRLAAWPDLLWSCACAWADELLLALGRRDSFEPQERLQAGAARATATWGDDDRARRVSLADLALRENAACMSLGVSVGMPFGT